jgi:hypothetical protein
LLLLFLQFLCKKLRKNKSFKIGYADRKKQITLQYNAAPRSGFSNSALVGDRWSAWRWNSPTKMSTQMTIKSTICLCVQYLFAVSGVQAETMGQTAIQATADSGNGNLLCAQQATLSLAGTLTSMSFYVSKIGGTLKLAVYDATGPDQAEDQGILKLRPRPSRR